MRFTKVIFIFLILTAFSFFENGCSHFSYYSVSRESAGDSLSAGLQPNYNVTLDFNYQDFTSYLFLGNRIDNFTAYFNTYFRANEDYNDAFDEYRASLISYYNRRLDSLGVSPAVSPTVKDKLDKAIERASKIIQFNKFSKFIDDAVLIIGKSYFIQTDYYKAERTFSEFISKFSSSLLADEAILYLGRTEVKLGKIDDGVVIFKNLLKNSGNNEIKSLAARDMGIIDYNNGNLEGSVKYFKESIDYTSDDERRAETQYILAKILAGYKPELAAEEYKKVLQYTSDYDLMFYSRLNYAKGLMHNKEYEEADEELESLRRKYRDEPSFTQLVDLEIANSLYAQNKIKEADEKYYEVIVKYPSTPVSSDAYYFLAKHDEEVNNDYVNALVNYKKAVSENASSDYYKESSDKSVTLARYFSLLGDIDNSSKVNIPEVNADVEKFRLKYNEEKGIEQTNTNPNTNQGGDENPKGNPDNSGDDGTQKGNGKGKPGGSKLQYYSAFPDSIKGDEPPVVNPNVNPNNPQNSGPVAPNSREENYNKRKKLHDDSLKAGKTDSTNTVNQDSLKAVEEARQLKETEDKKFNSYYEIAELFIYNLGRADSAERYLNLLLKEFTDADKQSKVLYTLGNFYKNNGRKEEADLIFNKIIATYPSSIYAIESKRILGIKSAADNDIALNAADAILKQALVFFNEKKYPETIAKLHEVETQYPNDTLAAKSLFSIGWIYENILVNKDSAISYYKQLKTRFPESFYTQQVTQLLDFFASLETKDSVKTTDSGEIKDSTAVVNQDNKTEETTDKKEEEVTVQPNNQNQNNENQLSKEEIDKLLKEGDESGK